MCLDLEIPSILAIKPTGVPGERAFRSNVSAFHVLRETNLYTVDYMKIFILEIPLSTAMFPEFLVADLPSLNVVLIVSQDSFLKIFFLFIESSLAFRPVLLLFL